MRTFAVPNDDAARTMPALIPGIAEPASCTYHVGRYGVDLKAVLPELHVDHCHDVPTVGHWSLHDMIGYLLTISGPATVWLATWGFSAEPLKAMLKLLRAGTITELNLLLSDRVKLQCPQAYQLLQSAMNEADIKARIRVRLEKTHVKMVVITNTDWSITVDTSANLTDNPRLEKYLIRTHHAAAVFNTGWMDLVMQGGKPFEAE